MGATGIKFKLTGKQVISTNTVDQGTAHIMNENKKILLFVQNKLLL